MTRTKDNWKEIEDINKEFAKFLGYQYVPYKEGQPSDRIGWLMPDKFIHLKVGTGIGTPYLCRRHKQLAFHYDWNWLMEVVEKIESMGFHVMINKWTSVYLGEEKISIVTESIHSKKENTYLALYRFVKENNKERGL